MFKELKQLDEALAGYNQAIALKADYADAYFNRSLTYLVRADFEHGWRDYEWRWKVDVAPRRFATGIKHIQPASA